MDECTAHRIICSKKSTAEKEKELAKAIRNGCDLNYMHTNWFGYGGRTVKASYSPVKAAICEGEWTLAKMLLEAGADPDKGSNLTAAVGRENKEFVTYLFTKGANPDYSETSYTPLNKAIFTKNAEMVRLLLDNDANPNLHDGWNNAPLIYAIIYGTPEIIEILLEKQADATVCGDNGRCVPLIARGLKGQGWNKIKRMEGKLWDHYFKGMEEQLDFKLVEAC